jgi:hypothetical protein
MKNTIINTTIVILLLILSYKLYNKDRIDLCNPFGTDQDKNMKYTKGKSGEDYGVGTFWGRPEKSDVLLDHLNKVQWLSNSYITDVLWRRSLMFSIIFGLILAYSINENTSFISRIVLCTLLIFIVSYFSLTYYKHHILWRRTKFIDTHIRKTKSKLNLPLNNKINENLII